MLAPIESLSFPQQELHSDHVSRCGILWEYAVMMGLAILLHETLGGEEYRLTPSDQW
jgi:hypothetical protein